MSSRHGSEKYSNQRYYCKFCNVYVLDNKSQVDKHNSGNKHKRQIEEHLKRQRKNKMRESRNERQLEKELAGIARAAGAAVGTTGGASGLTYKPQAWDSMRERPTPKQGMEISISTDLGDGKGANVGSDEGEGAGDGDFTAKPEARKGLYAIGEDWYLEGSKCENLLYPLAEVQVYVEAIDDWAEGIVLSVSQQEGEATNNGDLPPVNAISAPGVGEHTEGPTWVVEYVTPEGGMATIADVTSDDLRIRCTSSGVVLSAEEARDEDTGLGGWTTVLEEVVDETAIAAAQAAEEVEAALERSGAHHLKRPVEALDDGERDEDMESALGYYDGKGQGHADASSAMQPRLSNAARVEEESHALAAGAKVAFKKRKKKVKQEE